MDIKDFLEKKAGEINKEIEAFMPRKPTKEWMTFIANKADYVHDLKTTEESTNKPLWDFLDRGGKRWRPSLMLLSCEAVGGNPEKIKEFVVLPELVHNGTIIVDDVEDNSQLRRGKPTLQHIYGEDIAINAGNMLYFLPLKVIEKFLKENPSESEKALKIYQLYNEEMIRLSLGQAMDIYWHRGNANEVSEDQYLQMCVYKTGSLAKISAEIGALLGGADDNLVKLFGEFAASIGVAFQIQDDILNIAPSKDWGKEVGDDINEGKRTLLVIHALNNSSKEKAVRLTEILNTHTENQEEIKEAIGIIKESGAIDYANKKARTLVTDSWIKLEKELKDSEAKATLKSFADYLINREI